MRIGTMLIGGPVFIAVLIGVLLVLPLPEPIGNERLFSIGAAVAALGMVYLGAVGVEVTRIYIAPSRAVVGAFRALGFQHRAGSLLLAPKLAGQVDGRRVEVTFKPGLPLAELQVTIAAGTRFEAAIAAGAAFGVCATCPEVQVDARRDRRRWVARSRDAVRLYALVDQPGARLALDTVLGEQALPGRKTLNIQPARLWLVAHPTRMQVGDAAAVVSALAVLAEAAEACVVEVGFDV